MGESYQMVQACKILRCGHRIPALLRHKSTSAWVTRTLHATEAAMSSHVPSILYRNIETNKMSYNRIAIR